MTDKTTTLTWRDHVKFTSLKNIMGSNGLLFSVLPLLHFISALLFHFCLDLTFLCFAVH